MERIDERTPAQKLADYFVRNADNGDNEANTDLMQEMLQRMRAAGPHGVRSQP